MRRRAARICLILAVGILGTACGVDEARMDCGENDDLSAFILAAQAVPSASLIPCIDTLPTGWDLQGSETVEGAFSFWLASDRAGMQAVRVELVASCDVATAVEVTPSADEAGTRRFEEPLSLTPTFSADRFYTFPGGCVRVQYRFATSDSTLVLQADQAFSFRPRQAIVDRLADLGLVLCGVGAPECLGGD